jgi:hypothetical protein
MRAAGSELRDRYRRWKWALLALCGLSFALTTFAAADLFGIGSRPWFGWWDATTAIVAPYTLAVEQPRPGGASARAGLRSGDRIDLREQTLDGRVAIVYQPFGGRPTRLTVHRDDTTLHFAVLPSSVWEGAALFKVTVQLAWILACFWFALCATLIVRRRWWQRDAAILALVLLCITGQTLDPNLIAIPNPALALACMVFARACLTTASWLLVQLTSAYGVRSTWRSNLERIAYGAILLGFATDLAATFGLVTLHIDPLPYVFRNSVLRYGIDVTVWLLVTALASIAVAQTSQSDRPRTAWLLLPLPIGLLTSMIGQSLSVFTSSWFAVVAIQSGWSGGVWLLGALVVTYALLKRRVLDFEFVLSRTIVVGTVSLIVVGSFALLEWLLGTALVGVSHATGLVANGILALVLGLSLNPLQKRVDALVDAVLFRKRYDDERSLLDFSKEAAYVTDSEMLLDLAIGKIQHHTDARSAALMIEENDAFSAVRAFGDAPPAVNENDEAVLALKTWHKPLDPHHYSTRLRGALALPMLTRGRLFGLLLLGERAGGEAYAPDEVEALSQFAHGVGSALDTLTYRADPSSAALQESIASMRDAILSLRAVIVERTDVRS